MKNLTKIIVILIITVLCNIQVKSQQPVFNWAFRAGSYENTAEYPYNINVDSIGNIIWSGTFENTVDFEPGTGIYNLTSHSPDDQDMFVSKFSPAGSLLWAFNVGPAHPYSGCLDNQGNIIIGGSFGDTVDFDPTTNITYLVPGGSLDGFFAKYDNNGTLVWAKSLSGVAYGYIRSITCDLQNNIYVTGYFQGSMDIDPSFNVYNLTSTGQQDVFIIKFDLNGNLLWGFNVGGVDFDAGFSLATDSIGNVYIAGQFKGIADFDPSNSLATLTATGSDFDIFFAKYNFLGQYQWAKKIGNSTNDGSPQIILDANSNIYLSGIFSSSLDINPDTTVNTILSSYGLNDFFITKFNNNGDLLWGFNIGGNDADFVTEILISNDQLFVLGDVRSYQVDFDPSIDNSLLYPQNSDIFLAKYDLNGSFIDVNQISGSGYDSPFNLCKHNNDIFITGLFQNTADFDFSNNAYNLTSAGFYDMFIAKYSVCNIPKPSQPLGDTLFCLSTITSQYTISSVLDANNYIWQITPPNAGIITANDTISNITWSSGFSGIVSLKVKAIKEVCESIFSDSILINIKGPYQNEQICLVTVDETTGKNKVIWNKTDNVGTAYYNIFKQQGTGTYLPIGIRLFSETSEYIDNNSNPTSQAERYKISVVDTCDSPSLKSPYHRTMLLTISQGTLPTDVNLIWTPYEVEFGSFVPNYYYIYQGTNMQNMIKIDSVAGNENMKVLHDVLSLYYYQIGIEKDCNNIIKSSSNFADNGAFVGINKINTTSENLNIYPNPTNDKFTIEFSKNGIADIMDLQGRILKSVNLQNVKTIINMEEFFGGVYTIRIKTDKEIIVKKLIKQ